LVWAILTTIFCCLPAGVVSIVFAAQVNSKWNAGDQGGAQKASEKAKTWAIVSAVAGVIVGVISFVVQLSMASCRLLHR
ncbi:CD225/dispanin family protein, partial [Actinomadura sp. KC345]|uniref:CD225/dispanin family protein n=1 Tax=Actinomadura sp. KC345 TaxID=2530371 RepID=UPI001A9F1CCD